MRSRQQELSCCCRIVTSDSLEGPERLQQPLWRGAPMFVPYVPRQPSAVEGAC